MADAGCWILDTGYWMRIGLRFNGLKVKVGSFIMRSRLRILDIQR